MKPLPKRVITVRKTVDVELDLLQKVEPKLKSAKITFRQVVEWGLTNFLIEMERKGK